MLIVIMAMAVLSLLAIEFQQESFMQISMSKSRQDAIQCEYALESGLAAAGKLIQEYHDEMLTKIRNPKKSSPADISSETATPTPELPDNLPTDPEDPNYIDPEQWVADPNSTLGTAPEEWKGHLLKEATIEVGKAEATIYLFGENYKLPLTWAMQSPFSKTSGSLTMVRTLLTELDCKETGNIIKYLNMLTEDIDIPYVPSVVKRGNRWVRSGKSYTNEEVNLLTVKNHMLFAHVGSQWYKDTNNTRYPEIQEIVTLPSGNMVSDYIGLWGGIKVNINTAPAEVLTAAFGEVGLTRELADKIVSTRETQGLFRSPILIREIEGISDIYTAIYPLADVIDHVYTVKVTARSGEIEKTKSACFYRKGKKLEMLAVY